MALKFYNPGDVKEQYIKLLLYGSPGVGKTRTSCVDARGVLTPGPVIFGNVEGGIMSIRDLVGGHVKVVDLKVTPDDPRDGVDKLHELFSTLQKGGHGFKTLVLDSVTELQKVFVDRVTKDRRLDVADLKAWQIAQEKTRNALRMFRDLPMNVILVCLGMDDKNELTGQIKTKPSMAGKVSDEITAFMDEVAYMTTITTKDAANPEGPPITKRVWCMEITDNFYAKDRSGSCKPVMPASFAFLQQTIYPELATTQDAVDHRVAAIQ